MPGRSDVESDPQGILAQLRRMVALLSVAVVLIFAMVLGLGIITSAVLQPRLERDIELVRAIRELHESLLIEHAALREWLRAGDESALARVREQRATVRALGEAVMDVPPGRPPVERHLLAMLLAQQRWDDQWAVRVYDAEPGALAPEEVQALLVEGDELFGEYEERHAALIEAAIERRDQRLRSLQRGRVSGLLIAGILALALFVLVRRLGRRAYDSVVEPLEDLLATMERIGDGDMSATPTVEGPAEMRRLGQGLTTMAQSLARKQAQLEGERQITRETADALCQVLEVSREIAGSLSTRYVAETIAHAAERLADAERTRVWMTGRDDGRVLQLLCDSTVPRGVAPPPEVVHLGDGPVGAAARDARPTADGARSCYPLIVGGSAIGVLELQRGSTAPASEAAQEALETLALQAGAALEAARLHHRADELSNADSLTGLGNRRRMEADLATELDRTRRYGRRFSFVMVDIDHFKTLNDTYGHPLGDEVLRAVAELLTAGLRTSDTLYRYGGEEFALIARETDAGAAAELAERLRADIECGSGDGLPAVTASFGVAAAPTHASTAGDLIGAADRALYVAKARGRNRVVTAEVTVRP